MRFLVSLVFLASFAFANMSLSLSGEVAVNSDRIDFGIKNAKISDAKLNSFTHESLLICDHNLTGTYEIGENWLVLYPTDVKAGKKYTCKTNPKYIAQNSSTSFLSQDFSIKEALYREPDILKITFNDKVSKDEVLKNVSLLKQNKLSNSKLSYKIQNENGKTYVLKITEEYEKFALKISKNMHSIFNSKLKKDFSKEFYKNITINERDSSEAKTLVIYDKPIYVKNSDGTIAIRVFLDRWVDDNTRAYISIDKLKRFSVSGYRYIGYNARKKYNLDKNSDCYIDIYGDFKPNEVYKIKLHKGFGSSYEQLFSDEEFEVKTGDFGSYVGFADESKPYLSSIGEIGLKGVNVYNATIVIDKVMKENFRYFVNFSDGSDVSSMSKQVFSKKIAFDGKKNVMQDYKIVLKKDLPKLQSGAYLINVYYKVGKEKRVASKKVFISDIGISAKLAKNSLMIWTTRLSSNKLLSGANVKIYSDANRLLAQGYTDKFGIFKYSKKDFLSYNPHSAVVSKNGEKNFLVFDKVVGETSLFDRHDNFDKYSAYIYFQSDLIRPDENLTALVVIKDKEYKSLKKAPVSIVIKEPTGKKIYEKSFLTDETGAFSLVAPMLNQKTGKYRFYVYLANKNKATKNFMIEAFMPQRVKNSIKTAKDIYKSNAFMDVNLSSSYLFGAPAAELNAKLNIKAVSKRYENSKYKNYTFNNEVLFKKNSIVYFDYAKEFKLSSDGKAKDMVKLSLKQMPPSILKAQLDFSVSDDGKNVSSYKNVDIYPYEKIVGLKINKEYFDTNENVQIDTLMLNPFTNKEANNTKLNVYIKKLNWYHTYDSNGYYKWYEEYETMEHFTINAGEKIDKKFANSGDFIVEVYDDLGGHSASVEFSVRGWDYVSMSPNDDMSKNEVKFEDRLYKKGDVVKLDIKSPIKEGKMLVTLEGDDVYWHKVYSFKNARLKVDVPLENELKNGLYIHTIAVSSTATTSQFTPFRASSSNFIKPDKQKFKLSPKIISVDKAVSNSSEVIKIKARPNSKVAVFVVDDGILQILGQKPPRPFDYFNAKAKDMIADYDIYDLLMHHLTNGKRLKFGSGALMMKRKHLAPKTGAKRVKPFVFFSGLLGVDENGEAKTTLMIPSSYNSSATIVAIEISENAIGASSKKLTVKDDVIIKPVYPRFGAVGDKWKVPVRVLNTTKKALDINLSVASNIKIANLPSHVNIKPNSSKLFYMNLDIEKFGKGYVKLKADAEGKSFENSVEIPMIFPYPLQTYNVQGESDKNVSLKVPAGYINAFKPNYNLSISNDPLARVKSGFKYLISYPYGCAEQTSSRLFAMLNFEPFFTYSNEKEKKAKLSDAKRFINAGIDKLSSMQKNNGSFGYWSINSRVVPYASIYATDLLFSAENAGYKVPKSTMKNAIKSLKSFVNSNNSDFNKIYALYLLAQKNIINTSKVNEFYDKKIYFNSLPNMYMMAYILKKAKMHSEEKAVLRNIEDFDFTALSNRKRDYDRYYYSYPRDLAFALYLHAKHFKKNSISQMLLNRVKSKIGKLYSTQDKAFMLRALNEYYKSSSIKNAKFDVSIDNNTTSYDKSINLTGVYKYNDIKISPKGDWISYSLSVANYIPKKIKHEEPTDLHIALSIYRTFVDEKGNEVDFNDIRVGDKIYSKVEIFSSDNLSNIVINEQIPSNFEIVNERLKASLRAEEVQNSKNFNPDFTDIRDDRILTFLSLKAGKYVTFFTPLKATTIGTSKLPAILTEAMYDERINDYDLQRESVEVKEYAKREVKKAMKTNEKWDK